MERERSESQTRGVAATLRKVIAAALQLRVVRAALLYVEKKGPALADGVTYRALFSVFAAVLLGFSLVALWLGNNPQAVDALIDAIDSFIPGVSDAINLREISAPLGFSVAGVASLIGLIFAALGSIGSLRSALQTLADTEFKGPGPVLATVQNFLVAVSFGALLLCAALLSIITSSWLDAATRLLGFSIDPGLLQWGTRLGGLLVVFLIDTLAIVLIFRVLSGVKAPASALWYGAAIGGLGLLVLQELSGLFVRGATANPLLATFAALIALLLWINLSVQVVLFACGVIVVGAAESKDRVRERYGASTLAQLRRKRAEDRVRVATIELRSAQQAEAKERQRLLAAASMGSDSA